MRLGAGLLLALAVGAAAAGPWVLAAIALAGALAACALWTVPSGPSAPPKEVRALATAAGLAQVAVFGEVFGVYLFPLHRGVAAAVLVLAVAAAELAGLRLPEWSRKWIAGALVVAAAVLVALCVAIQPVSTPSAGGFSAVGLLMAVVVMFPWLLPDRPGHGVRRVVGATAMALVVAGAALYQLGPVRLGLSADSMRDVLAAADAESLAPLLAVVVVVATASAALGTFGDVREESRAGTVTLVGCAVVTAAVAGLATPVATLVLAAVLAIARVLVTLPARYRVRRD